jgi:hypothetical protein
VNYADFEANCRSGDAILFRGRGIACGLIRKITKSTFDHIGIVVRDRNNKAFIVDATGDGVCMHRWEKFVRKKWHKPYVVSSRVKSIFKSYMS